MQPPTRRRGRAFLALAVCAVIAGSLVAGQHLWRRATQDPKPAPAPAASASAQVARFVGEAACAPCHAREAALWSGSHHNLAMQPVSAASVLGDFADARFTYAGVESRFYRSGGQYLVRTDGADGALHEYAITHTFGFSPLQQYLVAVPGGRLQALEIAWDSRPAGAGGQRWFHLYPNEKVTSSDPLHWTGATENWNYMCADCHSTNVRKGFDARTNGYSTSFAEVSVSCEACHGPGSQHVAWAKQPGERRRAGDDKGLSIMLDEHAGVSWMRDENTGKPRRSIPRQSEREIQMCARCHSRRGLIHEDYVRGQPVDDDYRVALFDEELYYPDGQIKGEVYEYGSFIQSRMFAEGVTCSDCHDPHRPELRGSDDAVCLRCHAASAYFAAKHHFHPADFAGSHCVNCHMPATTFMVIDPRRDHSLRVPRPDLSVKLGVPNACNGCHADRSARWAARTVEKWYGHTPSGLQQYAEAIAAGTQGAPGAQSMLAALVADSRQPAIARASALQRMEHQVTAESLATVQGALGDPSPLVRRAAVRALADVEPQLRVPLVAPLLADAVRAVRIEAATAMADVPPGLVSSADRAALDRAIGEYVAAQETNGDRPEAHFDLAFLYSKQRRFDRAESELKRALALDPSFAAAAVNLADLYRAMDRDDAAEPVLREALRHAPRNPSLMHALGLRMVRAKRLSESLEWLGAAARLGTGNPRYGYVYAVALHGAGRKREALRELEGVLRRSPFDRAALSALMTFHREAGDFHEALQFAERLAVLFPQEPEVQAQVRELRARVGR